MEKRLLLAVAFSILIIITFQSLGPKPTQPTAPVRLPIEEKALSAAKETEIVKSSPAATPVEEKEIMIENEKFALTFSNIGGSIKNVRLKNYRNLKTNDPLEICSIKNPTDYIASLNSILTRTPLDLSGYQAERTADGIVYTLKSEDISITKRYTLHKSKYFIELQLLIRNPSMTPRKFNYEIIGGSSLRETDIKDGRFVEVLSKISGKVAKSKVSKDGQITNIGYVDWTALKDKYFAVVLKPFASVRGQFTRENRDKELITGVESEILTIQPNSALEAKYIIYIGPSQISDLKEAGCGLEDTIDYGFFGGISKALIVVMKLFFTVVRSWGVAIILLAIFLNIILFPLTMKSFKSIQKMQELHPEMEKLKKQHKDNPQKLNKEMMELYKKYKINPLSGCLPMILQMPIFFALYQALMKSIELRGTKFLWIKDLSSPDAVHLPFTLPLLGNSINILPILMVGAMVMQQKMSTHSMGAAVTDEQKQQQKIMLIMMPIMFGFIFYNMPAGLVLYWLFNTVLTVVEQGFILKKD